MRDLHQSRSQLFSVKQCFVCRQIKCILLLCLPVLGCVDSALGQESDQLNYGREARESTPILNRDPDEPLNERERIYHVLSRCTFGPTPELIKQVEEIGLQKWINLQLEGKQEESAVLLGHLAPLDSLELSNQEIVRRYNPPLPADLSLSKKLTPQQLRRRAALQRSRNVPRSQLKDAVLLRAVYSYNQLREVAGDFWRNHFNVDVSKGNVRFYATTYEREVIRAESLGSFEKMLNKQARHPAMLVYLDNFISRATPQRDLAKAAEQAFTKSRDYATALEAIDIARMRGLNENYGRELMELHTLGVDNGYTQDDVIAVSEALTGWTVQQDRDTPIEFQFRSDMHSSAPRMILKRRVAANPANPEMEGQAVLDMLVKHRGTSEFLGYKLCRHFVNDNPPRPFVLKVAAAYRRGRSDLPTLYRAILKDRGFYDPANYQVKFKRPFEFVVSALRVTRAEITSTEGIHAHLTTMGEPTYQCEDPTGYYDQADAWRDPGVMVPRWQFAYDLGRRKVKGVTIPDSFWEDLKPNNPLQWKQVLSERILPMGHTQRTEEALNGVIAKYAVFNPEPDELGRFIVGILLGSPEFQRQ